MAVNTVSLFIVLPVLQCLCTDCLHLRHLSLVFDDGAVQLLLLGSQLQLQLPVLLLLPVHLGAGASVASPHRLPPVHHLSQLVDSLGGGKKKKKHRDGSFYRDPLEINLNSVSAAGISMLLQHRFSKTCFTSRWFCPEFNTSLQLSIILNNRWCDITDVWGEKKKLRVYKKLPGFPDLCGQPDTHLNF